MRANSTPGSVAAALGVIAACAVAFGHLNNHDAALAVSSAAALGTLIVAGAGAQRGKPVSLQLVTGAAAVLLSDLTLFGVHLTPYQRGALAAAVAMALSLALHLLHVTVTREPAPVRPGSGVHARGAAHRPSAVTPFEQAREAS